MNGVRRFLMSAFMLCLIYFNAAVILNWPLKENEMGEPFPVWAPARDLFLLCGVFSYYETTNRELTIWGLAVSPLTGDPYWKELPREDYFTGGRGERDNRMWASRQYNKRGTEYRWQSWRFMGRRIYDRYNGLHPLEPITKVAFQMRSWPRSPEGFYAKELGEGTTRQYWVIMDSAPHSPNPFGL